MPQPPRTQSPRTPRTSRALSDEDRKVWRRVARTVTPKEALAERPPPLPARPPRVANPRPPEATPLGPLEVAAGKKVRRGQVRIDRRIDLHGLTLAEARNALLSSLVRASNRNQRCVLVITGKGPQLQGALRQALPGWLGEADLRPLVATYAPAHAKHGGAGAWYVFVR